MDRVDVKLPQTAAIAVVPEVPAAQESGLGTPPQLPGARTLVATLVDAATSDAALFKLGVSRLICFDTLQALALLVETRAPASVWADVLTSEGFKRLQPVLFTGICEFLRNAAVDTTGAVTVTGKEHIALLLERLKRPSDKAPAVETLAEHEAALVGLIDRAYQKELQNRSVSAIFPARPPASVFRDGLESAKQMLVMQEPQLSPTAAVAVLCQHYQSDERFRKSAAHVWAGLQSGVFKTGSFKDFYSSITSRSPLHFVMETARLEVLSATLGPKASLYAACKNANTLATYLRGRGADDASAVVSKVVDRCSVSKPIRAADKAKILKRIEQEQRELAPAPANARLTSEARGLSVEIDSTLEHGKIRESSSVGSLCAITIRDDDTGHVITQIIDTKTGQSTSYQGKALAVSTGYALIPTESADHIVAHTSRGAQALRAYHDDEAYIFSEQDSEWLSFNIFLPAELPSTGEQAFFSVKDDGGGKPILEKVVSIRRGYDTLEIVAPSGESITADVDAHLNVTFQDSRLYLEVNENAWLPNGETASMFRLTGTHWEPLHFRSDYFTLRMSGDGLVFESYKPQLRPVSRPAPAEPHERFPPNPLLWDEQTSKSVPLPNVAYLQAAHRFGTDYVVVAGRREEGHYRDYVMIVSPEGEILSEAQGSTLIAVAPERHLVVFSLSNDERRRSLQGGRGVVYHPAKLLAIHNGRLVRGPAVSRSQRIHNQEGELFISVSDRESNCAALSFDGVFREEFASPRAGEVDRIYETSRGRIFAHGSTFYSPEGRRGATSFFTADAEKPFLSTEGALLEEDFIGVLSADGKTLTVLSPDELIDEYLLDSTDVGSQLGTLAAALRSPDYTALEALLATRSFYLTLSGDSPVTAKIINDVLRQDPRALLDALPIEQAVTAEPVLLLLDHLAPGIRKSQRQRVGLEVEPSASERVSSAESQRPELSRSYPMPDISGGDPANKNPAPLAKIDQSLVGEFLVTDVFTDVFPSGLQRGDVPVNGSSTSEYGPPCRIDLIAGVATSGAVIPVPLESRVKLMSTGYWALEHSVQGLPTLQSCELDESDPFAAADADRASVPVEVSPVIFEPLPDISSPEYVAFTERILEGVAKSSREQFRLPLEATEFLDQISQLPPLQRAEEIEHWVREKFFYDNRHAEVRGSYSYASPQQATTLMLARTASLRARGDEAEKLEGKLFSGVCTQAALLGAILARESGLVAAYMTGYAPSSSELKASDAHADFGVFFPDTFGNPRLVHFSPTPPDGVNLVASQKRKRPPVDNRGGAVCERQKKPEPKVIASSDPTEAIPFDEDVFGDVVLPATKGSHWKNFEAVDANVRRLFRVLEGHPEVTPFASMDTTTERWTESLKRWYWFTSPEGATPPAADNLPELREYLDWELSLLAHVTGLDGVAVTAVVERAVLVTLERTDLPPEARATFEALYTLVSSNPAIGV